MVIATQNPIEQAGTYQLPEAQLDRFLMRIALGYPSAEATEQLLLDARTRDRAALVTPVLTPEHVVLMAQTAADVHVDRAIVRYVRDSPRPLATPAGSGSGCRPGAASPSSASPRPGPRRTGAPPWCRRTCTTSPRPSSTTASSSTRRLTTEGCASRTSSPSCSPMFRRRATATDRSVVLGPAGRGTLILGLVAAGGAWWGGYDELLALAVVCALCLVTAAMAVAVPAPVDARLELTPAATTAGRPGRAVLRATWRGPRRWRRPLVAVRMRGPDGTTTWSHARLPDLHHGIARTHDLELAAVERGVVEVGPVGARRTDPLGLIVRHEAWTGSATLHVRPRLIGIDTMGTASVPDLEGAASEQVSMSDLAFHALREYVRGDDLRHVHWRSSAKAGALHVRQYHETRRSHLVVLVDDHAPAYPRPVDFELALSVAASITLHLAHRGQAVTYGRRTVDGGGRPGHGARRHVPGHPPGCRPPRQGGQPGRTRDRHEPPGPGQRRPLRPGRLVAARDRSRSTSAPSRSRPAGRSAPADGVGDPTTATGRGLRSTDVRRLVDLPGALAVRALGVGE